MTNGLGWSGIVRLGLVQMMLGAVVVLTTSTLNRVMVVELALPALVPGLLVAIHYAVQLARPRMGFGADVGGRSTPWIAGGMAVLAGGGWLAAIATAWMGTERTGGLALAAFAFFLVGLGVAACGTSLLVLLAKRVDAPRRASAATIVWVMMIVGFAVTAGSAGRFLDPYTPARLIAVSGTVSALALIVTLVAVWRLEGAQPAPAPADAGKPRFVEALRQVWQEPAARRFTVFVFASMLAYSAQDLILEPFAGAVFALTPGATTQLSGLQHGGVLAGMLLAAIAGRRGFGTLRGWTVGGCLLSALALLGLVVGGVRGAPWPIHANVFALGAANGAFSIAAIASMMHLAAEGGGSREGVRMGLWGASQAISFAIGGLLGAVLSDLARRVIDTPGGAYGAVFFAEALLFVFAAVLAARIATPQSGDAQRPRRSAWMRSTPTMPS